MLTTAPGKQDDERGICRELHVFKKHMKHKLVPGGVVEFTI